MILSLLLLVATYSIASEDFSALEKKMDGFVETFQPAPNAGIAVGIIRGSELVFFKGYGYRDKEKKLPVTADTRFAIGSVTKNFVSTSLALLQERSMIRLDLPLQNYLPDFQLENVEIAKQATLADLLSHQVGLPRHDLLWYLTPFRTEELYQKLRYLELDKREGMGFRSGKTQYNNLMFMTAGIAIEKVGGVDWKSFVRENFVNPLGMSDTSFDLSGFSSENAALPYVKEEKVPYKSLDSISAAGSINSTVSDMAKWVGFHLAGGKIGSQQLLKQEAMEDLYRPRSALNGSGLNIDYGLAFMISKIGDHRVVYHGGNIDGFSAMIGFVPEQNLGLVILVNQGNAGNFQYPIKVEVGDGKPAVSLFPYLILESLLPKSESETLVASEVLNIEFPNAFRANRFSELKFASESVSESGVVGEFYEMAYGKLQLALGAKNEQLFVYYGNTFEMKPTEVENQFSLHAPSGGENIGLVVELTRVGSQVESIKVPFEPAVRPIQFVRETR